MNNLEKPQYVSAEGLKKLQAELDDLRTTKRDEVAQRIHAAMEFGDYSENSELEQAKNDQAFLEGRIMTLEQMIKNAQLIDEKAKHDIVEIGSHVTIEAEGRKEKYVIVGSAEADPPEGKISNKSRVARALMAPRPADPVNMSFPGGAIEMKITAISGAGPTTPGSGQT